jgi:hypothetical protein
MTQDLIHPIGYIKILEEISTKSVYNNAVLFTPGLYKYTKIGANLINLEQVDPITRKLNTKICVHINLFYKQGIKYELAPRLKNAKKIANIKILKL